MTRIDLTALSIEELWALHEEIAAVLPGRLSVEKQKLEKRLDELGRKFGGSSARQRRSYQEFIPSFETQNRLTKHGPVVATSHVGCANCLRPAKVWMIFAFTKSLRVCPGS